MTRRIDEIIVHCSVTRPAWLADRPLADQVAEIRRWHTEERGWSDVGYHWIVGRDGSIASGRREATVGAHCAGCNRHSLGICLIGGHGASESDRFEENFTREQDDALRDLIDTLRDRYGQHVRVTGHHEYAAKSCPGFRVGRWLSRRPPARTSPAQSTTLQASAAQVAAAAGTGATAIAALDGTAQIVALVLAAIVTLAAGWIARERLRRWAQGDR